MNPKLERLLNRWLEGDLTPPEEAAVQRLLVEDPEARRVYYELLMVDKMLNETQETVSSSLGMMNSLADNLATSSPKIRLFPARIVAIAALVALSLFAAFFLTRQLPESEKSGPRIAGSIDSRITIAQRQDSSRWEVGELLRLERGTAAIQLNPSVSGNFEGPAAIELADSSGNIRLLEGMASFQVSTSANRFDVRVPGGILRDMSSRFTTEVLADGGANVRIESGMLEIRPRGGREALYLKAGDAIRLESNGASHPIRLPNQHFLSGLPEQVTIFRDDFQTTGDQLLTSHRPEIGQAWKATNETNPTYLRNQTLDTSSGARNLFGTFAPHDAGGARSVYILTFHLVPPQWIHDKVSRREGVELISLTDSAGQPIISIFAEAANSHRWQLRDERSKAVTALTPVCALWTHSLTLCYGLDGRATLHDGATAQAPVVAEMRLDKPDPVSGISIANRNGGDLAFSSIETTLLATPRNEP
ncbi:hypothetical protein JIN84_19255 [Luteolibacter yonseiensis]|uniref:FecR protein domain-containing protein n=1 Tax=Luteolibacter yonseiensis TaxID=1144680 RepID=A0A934R5V3_9BACT|nr:hypothetical protein [Luteolibacter yonseiensis]MBK1817766.1 hypothetical protein [Luteolibacter yonseiensis]